MLKEKLHNWLNGEASKADTDALRANPETASYLKIAEATAEFTVPEWHADAQYDQLQQRLLKDTSSTSTERNLRWLGGIAAAIAVVAVAYFFLATQGTEITTRIAQKESITLPDQSVVALNAASTLRYDNKGWEEDRQLTLEGEAFFDVEKGKTFTVTTSYGTVEVLGTEFNVHSRPSQFSVSCYEGLVRVRYGDTVVDVAAGNTLRVVSGGLQNFRHATVSTPSWMQEESSFENTSLALIIEELERQYPITINRPSNLQKQFTGNFPHNDLEVALRSVFEPLGLTYTIDGEHVTIYAAAED